MRLVVGARWRRGALRCRDAGERADRALRGGRGDQWRIHFTVDDDRSVAATAMDPDLLVAEALVSDGVFGWALSALYFHGYLVGSLRRGANRTAIRVLSCSLKH